MATTTETKDYRATQAVITGEAEDVQAAVDRYFGNYSPFGYNTHTLSDVTTEGVRTVTITRWNSCD
jgi:hypothetical protein